MYQKKSWGSTYCKTDGTVSFRCFGHVQRKLVEALVRGVDQVSQQLDVAGDREKLQEKQLIRIQNKSQ